MAGISGKADAAKFHFSPATYLDLRADRIATFSWGAAMSSAPLLIILVLASVLWFAKSKNFDEYLRENIYDATFTGFGIASVAIANTCFSSYRPTSYRKIRLWTHLTLGVITIATLCNMVIHVTCTATNYKNSDVYLISVALSFAIFVFSWILQISYVKDATYRA